MNDDSGLLGHVIDELMSGLEKKDKALVIEALKAAILHIHDEDNEQDQTEGV